MKKKRANPNKGIMFGIMAMAIVVLAVVVFFWMWCLPDGTHGTEETQTGYRWMKVSGVIVCSFKSMTAWCLAEGWPQIHWK